MSPLNCFLKEAHDCSTGKWWLSAKIKWFSFHHKYDKVFTKPLFDALARKSPALLEIRVYEVSVVRTHLLMQDIQYSFQQEYVTDMITVRYCETGKMERDHQN